MQYSLDLRKSYTLREVKSAFADLWDERIATLFSEEAGAIAILTRKRIGALLEDLGWRKSNDLSKTVNRSSASINMLLKQNPYQGIKLIFGDNCQNYIHPRYFENFEQRKITVSPEALEENRFYASKELADILGFTHFHWSNVVKENIAQMTTKGASPRLVLGKDIITYINNRNHSNHYGIIEVAKRLDVYPERIEDLIKSRFIEPRQEGGKKKYILTAEDEQKLASYFQREKTVMENFAKIINPDKDYTDKQLFLMGISNAIRDNVSSVQGLYNGADIIQYLKKQYSPVLYFRNSKKLENDDFCRNIPEMLTLLNTNNHKKIGIRKMNQLIDALKKSEMIVIFQCGKNHCYQIKKEILLAEYAAAENSENPIYTEDIPCYQQKNIYNNEDLLYFYKFLKHSLYETITVEGQTYDRQQLYNFLTKIKGIELDETIDEHNPDIDINFNVFNKISSKKIISLDICWRLLLKALNFDDIEYDEQIENKIDQNIDKIPLLFELFDPDRPITKIQILEYLNNNPQEIIQEIKFLIEPKKEQPAYLIGKKELTAKDLIRIKREELEKFLDRQAFGKY